ncbi:hypothetical protein PENSPDRAFT_663432 [Peniophora sp. CONT]|nr:hypothetical protein PENSPDRAFT_663432 [Peniophora sp. CONT]
MQDSRLTYSKLDHQRRSRLCTSRVEVKRLLSVKEFDGVRTHDRKPKNTVLSKEPERDRVDAFQDLTAAFGAPFTRTIRSMSGREIVERGACIVRYGHPRALKDVEGAIHGHVQTVDMGQNRVEQQEPEVVCSELEIGSSVVSKYGIGSPASSEYGIGSPAVGKYEIGTSAVKW